MANTNKEVLRRVKGDGASLFVKEVFATIQGEGPFAGERAVFIRLAGCNLACAWCDTDYRQGHTPAQDLRTLTLSALRARESFGRWPDPLFVITGGEPFRQPIGLLVDFLLGEGFRVQIETSGSLWQDVSVRGPNMDSLHIVVSPKLAKVHPKIRKHACAWKYVISADDTLDPSDGLPLSSTQKRGERCKLARPPEGAEVYVQPMDEGCEIRNRKNAEIAADIALAFGYTFSVQLHKVGALP